MRLVPLLALSLAGFALASGATSPAEAHAGSLAATPQPVVFLLAPHRARAEPSAHGKALVLVPASTPITGRQTALPVIGSAGNWLEVQLPGRPNGHTGWISRTSTSLSTTPWQIVVDISRREVTVYRAGRRVRTFRAVVGKASTPTPTGEFFVEESIALPVAAVGAPLALALSARSDVLRRFDGGPGQIALHGRGNIGGDLGSAESHGCVRLGTPALRWLVARIGPGVPVTITR